ncbi:MAG: glutamine synthetase [Deltaproteobacteria bacterium]|jgi:glutamine synthetase|nr:glutamine synthetase [Deltaproteobacteria bacterium]MBW2534089.1 glutamine synthetase [Deltaproteobacteria bacterium]
MSEPLPLTHPLSRFLDRPPSDFRRADLLKVVAEYGIERFSFHYTGMDNQLKELKLPFSDLAQAERILAAGERVDGSSLFKGLVDASNSDLYVVPRYRTAFVSPFDPRSLDFMCRFLDRDGNRAPFPPDNILSLAHQRFKEQTGLAFHALGELEFFLVGDGGPRLFNPGRQTGYHASAPFFTFGDVVNEMVRHIMQITGAVKYAHAEVGFIDSIRSDLEVLKGKRAEQHEIEFLTRPIEEMGDFIAMSRWIIRNVAFRRGMLATFAPKLEEGVAGNGFHVHMELVRDGKNIMLDEAGALSTEALKLIGGLIHHASTLSAFGNTVASAFLRLVPNQEAPTRIAWSDCNRSALVRVPLGWRKSADLARAVNPSEPTPYEDTRGHQTVEIRSPDGSAFFNLLLAGLTAAALHGLTQPGMLELAQKTKVEGNVFSDDELMSQLEPLPGSCMAAARLLESRRALYERDGLFPARVIDHVVAQLRREQDDSINETMAHLSAEERLTATRQIMHRDIHRS